MMHIFSDFLPLFQKGISLSYKEFHNKKCLHKKSFSSKVSRPIFLWPCFFWFMAMKCNEFLGDILSPCKLCKKVLCGFEKCLVSKVVFYIMLDVAWNSLVLWWSWVWARKNWRVVSLFSNDGCVLGTQTLTNSIRSRLLCLPSSSFPTVHQLAKNRNRTSRAWRGPHPLHIIVFSVGRNDDKISKLRCKRQTNMRPYPWSNIPMAKLCSIHKSFLIYWSLFIWPLPGLKYQFLWWNKNTYKCFNWNIRLLFWCKISLVSQVTTASCLLYLCISHFLQCHQDWGGKAP